MKFASPILLLQSRKMRRKKEKCNHHNINCRVWERFSHASFSSAVFSTDWAKTKDAKPLHSTQVLRYPLHQDKLPYNIVKIWWWSIKALLLYQTKYCYVCIWINFDFTQARAKTKRSHWLYSNCTHKQYLLNFILKVVITFWWVWKLVCIPACT